MVGARATGVLDPRQLWNPLPTPTRTSHRYCTPFTLPSNGVLSFGDTAITLTTNARFVPECTGEPTTDISLASAMKDPFYASTIPQTYVISATTIIAWILVVMLVITPRTNFLGQTWSSPGISRGHGVIGGSTGGNINIIGVGSRPWLQKLAAFSVAVALTIATADMFREAHQQYADGYMDANRLREFVLGSLEIRIARVVSDILVWLAQVQTLVRLFPRHKEKVLIKWIGFCLIIFDTVFSCVNAFYVDEGGPTRPRRFVNAIPALSYLFELSLGLLYAAWVVYYAVSKRRYAFHHPKMRSILVIAVLSIIAICTPVVFFVIDVSNPDVAGWGDYFRWVGAAAASVVVWEWVERIEAIERDEMKDGILGREVFDGDEMLDLMPTDQIVWNSGRSRRYRRGGGDGSSTGGHFSTDYEDGSASIFAPKFRRRQKRQKQQPRMARTGSSETVSNVTHNQNGNTNTKVSFAEASRNTSVEHRVRNGGVTVPAPVASPINRADTSSAGSTVYVVRYDNAADVPQAVRRNVDPHGNGERAREQLAVQRRQMAKETIAEEEEQPSVNRDHSLWHTVPNPFKRKRVSPPTEVQKAKEAAAAAAGDQSSLEPCTSRWKFKNGLPAFAGTSGDKTHERSSRQQEAGDEQIIVIPAQQRRCSLRPNTTAMPAAAQQRTTPPGSSVAMADTDSPGSSNARTTSTAPRRERVSHMLSPSSVALQQLSSRTDNSSPIGAGGAASNATLFSSSHLAGRPGAARRPTFSSPPRADDISPVVGGAGPTVIPAPRRSPAKTGTSSAGGSSAMVNSGGV